MNNLPYSEGGLDGGMFHPSVLDRKEREYQQYMDTQTPIAAQKIRNFVNGNNNHSLSQALPNEVLYDQNYVNQIANELERVKLQLLLTQRELNLKNNQLNDAYLNISKGNATINRLDDLIDDLKAKLSSSK
ncbi:MULTISPECIES: hypothetical protein [Acinetobacter]|jgi:hypothetical protein|uniref:hypothetical protein n=1 Tax=Acinetobacter TaxID=469 RepID=UPI001EFEFA82|nr:hypothetical protein [Acinetobacter nosocomialis]UKC63503.1 hypothetical protein FA267_2_00029 [Acinetobacter nosocomialis]UKC63684.1 hypothetical protein FA648_2_00075 [Acinetobacter nosocomialis]